MQNPLTALCTASTWVHATISSCLDYVSSFLTGLPASTVLSFLSFLSKTAGVILFKYVTFYTFPFWVLQRLPVSLRVKAKFLTNDPWGLTWSDSPCRTLLLILLHFLLFSPLLHRHWPPCSSDIPACFYLRAFVLADLSTWIVLPSSIIILMLLLVLMVMIAWLLYLRRELYGELSKNKYSTSYLK